MLNSLNLWFNSIPTNLLLGVICAIAYSSFFVYLIRIILKQCKAEKELRRVLKDPPKDDNKLDIFFKALDLVSSENRTLLYKNIREMRVSHI